MWEGDRGHAHADVLRSSSRSRFRSARARSSTWASAPLRSRSPSTWAWSPAPPTRMLACARIGATHSVIFGGFSAEALRESHQRLRRKVLLTQTGAWMRGSSCRHDDGRRTRGSPHIGRRSPSWSCAAPQSAARRPSRLRMAVYVWWHDCVASPPASWSTREAGPRSTRAPLFITL